MKSEQQLIDLMFEIAIVSAERLNHWTKEEVANWVASVLESKGFKTIPQGMSWGVLVNEKSI